MSDVEFLVDAYKHRIVKRDGLWRLYCPYRGGDAPGIIMAPRFPLIRAVLLLPCVERVDGHLESHGMPMPPSKLKGFLS